jgi:hypothetical protein
MTNNRAFVNPILAGDWLPIARSIAYVLERLPLKTHAVANFMSFGLDEWSYSSPVRGPYFQVWHDRGGRLLGEVGFGPELIEANPQVTQILAFLGFTPPTPGDPNHPNFSKFYAAGWNASDVTRELISGVLMSNILTTEVGFHLFCPDQTAVADLGLVTYHTGLRMWVAAPGKASLTA